ncbi:DUF7522 family protein [Halomarina litorea]|uniref:DUF7522 family protein n=1 Tax=Halomarina litorea TaxID=2961595 RepID=UPI0020C1EC74|nr:hypothetical protein [Halomarina sp. BCD28]
MTDSGGPLLGPFRAFGGDALRDVWVFDGDTESCLFIRDDVTDYLEGHDPEPYIDNERYGYITRDTYEDLTYASYEYTVRGLDEFVQFRTFLDDDTGTRFGVLASFDVRRVDDRFGDLYERLASVGEDVTFASLGDQS